MHALANMSSSQSFSYLVSVSMLLIFPLLANAHSCSEGFIIEAKNINITQYCKLKNLGVEFAWNFDNKSRQLDVAIGARLESETAWLAWGLNPHGPHMVGTRALIGIKLHNGSSLEGHKYNITDTAKRGCQLLPSDDDIELGVRTFRFVHLPKIEYHAIMATIILPNNYNSSSTHVVWQIGRAASDSVPWMHPTSLENLDSAETVNLMTSEVLSYKPHERRQLRTAHGILNIVGWGIFIPVGVIVARYFRMYPKEWKWWFVFHVGCQITGYALGLIGWAIGLWLGQKSKYYTFATHRILAIIIFTFTTIQMMALRLKPKRTDEYRAYWNMYHHFLGYALLALISFNIFEGIKIFETDLSWRWSYIGVLGVLGAVALAFEFYTWIKFSGYWPKLLDQCKRNQRAKSNTPDSAVVQPGTTQN